jgi:hypothetical protein
MLSRIGVIALASLILSAPALYAQATATVFGTIADEQKAVLPGATVMATELTTGRVHTTVSDVTGEYRLVGVPPGTYKIQAELAGFATAVIPSLELLVGQNANVPFTLRLAGLEESVTVTSEAPLVDISSSEVAGNVDRREMEELPLQGRNWLELSMQVKGITANNITNTPGVSDVNFQLNLDGQQITQKVAGSGFGQPKFSREAIAEFQILTNLFDITQGRSNGIQVQAISRSGTNNLNGNVYGYFRHDNLNAADFVAQEVLPYENQQVGGTIGGPIQRDRIHYFASYEYERQPNTVFVTLAQLPSQEFAFPYKDTQNSVMGRVDQVINESNNLSYRGSYWDFENPFDLSSTAHPSQAAIRTQDATNFLMNWSRVINANMVQEVKVGYNGFNWANLLAVPEMHNTPNYVFQGLTIGGPRNFPQQFHQDLFSGRYDLNWHKGSHDFKIGGEFLGWKDTGEWHLLERGEFIFNSRPPTAELEARFPQSAWNDPTGWNVVGLDPRINRFDQNVGDWTIDIPRPSWAIWFGDNWQITDRLTVNYGVRWDDDWGATAPPHVTTTTTWDPVGGNPPFAAGEEIVIGPGDRVFDPNIRDHNNVAPRAGFAYNVGGTGDLVIRGGSGLYYSIPVSNTTFSQQSFNGERILVNSFANDGQPNFVLDPKRGVTNDDILEGRVPLPPQAPRVIAHDYRMPYTWQSSIGFQKQLGPVMGVEADLTFNRAYNVERGRDINLFFDPATGYNRDPGLGRPDPKWGQLQWIESNARGENMQLSTGFTRRLRDNFQGGLTYTYTFLDQQIGGGFGVGANNQFNLDAEWGPSHPQRHTLRANALYRLPWDFSVSAVYFYGSRDWSSTTLGTRPFGKPGTNRLNAGAPITVRQVPEFGGGEYVGPAVIGTMEETCRACFIPKTLHKVDFRVSKEISLGGDVRLMGIAEVFNLFNHENFSGYTTQIDSSNFGRPTQSTGNAYVPRSGQLGFRLSW